MRSTILSPGPYAIPRSPQSPERKNEVTPTPDVTPPTITVPNPIILPRSPVATYVVPTLPSSPKAIQVTMPHAATAPALVIPKSPSVIPHPSVTSPGIPRPTIPLPTITSPGIPRPTIPLPTITSPGIPRPTIPLSTISPPTIPRPPISVSSPTIPRPPILVSSPTIPRPTLTLPTIPRPTLTLPTIPRPTLTLPTIPRPTLTLPTSHAPLPSPGVPRPTLTLPTLPVGMPKQMLKLAVGPIGRPMVTMPLSSIPMPKMVIRPKKTDMTLIDWQLPWAMRLMEILSTNTGAIDTSPMGSGKTYVQCWLAQQLNLPLIIVCPTTVMSVWKKLTDEFGIPVALLISYESLRSVTNKQPKHGYLVRVDRETEGGIIQTSFAPTQKYLDLVSSGVLVIGDEVQKVKNHTDQYKAFSVLVRAILSRRATGTRSRYTLLSGTIIDKEEQVINMLRLTGFINSTRMYRIDNDTRMMVYEGIQELIDACHSINRAETDAVLSEEPITKKNMNHLCYTLFTRIIKYHIAGGMLRPDGMGVTFDVKNGFYNIGDGRGDLLTEAIETLARAIRFNDRTGAIDGKGVDLGKITTALRLIEVAKVPDIARIGTNILTETENDKVIFCLNYLDPIEELTALMAFYNPLILTGATSQKKRAAVIEQFNTNLNFRVLIMNTEVGSIGISLHDIVGDAPRHMIISPSYKLLSVVQATNRIYRTGVMSNCSVRMFYGKGDNERETKILAAYARKSAVVRGTLTDENAQQMLLPDQYEADIEPDV